MQTLSTIKKEENLHHFNIVESGTESDVLEVCKKVLGFDRSGNPNYFYKKYDSFLVEDARELVELQSRKHKIGDKVVFVLEIGSINIQSQNALLKIFEEATLGTYFFLLVSQSNILLQTLLSRAAVYKGEYKQSDSEIEFPNLKQIRKMSIKDRMDLVTDWQNQYKKEKIQKSDMKNFLNNLISEMNDEVLARDSSQTEKLKRISDLVENFDNNGAHIKSILEFVVLTI